MQVSGHGLTSMTKAGRLLVRADRPLSLIARYRPAEVTVTCSARQATALTLAVGGVPLRVEVNGRIVATQTNRADAAAQTVTVDLAAGRHELRITLQSKAAAGVAR